MADNQFAIPDLFPQCAKKPAKRSRLSELERKVLLLEAELVRLESQLKDITTCGRE